MLGAIIGDIAGSYFEFDRHRQLAHSKEFELIYPQSIFTDDTVLTLAIADALMNAIPVKGTPVSEENFEANVIKSMRTFAAKYPNAGYGARFIYWLMKGHPQPYGSFGNGSAMRVSPVAWAFDTLEDVEKFAEVSARVSHNHPEGIKGAQEIKNYIINRYNYDLSRTLDEIRPKYRHVETCQETVPEAITAFLEGTSFEGVTREAVSLSGDSDTLTAIACSIAEGFYGIPDEICDLFLPKLDDYLTDSLLRWELWRA